MLRPILAGLAAVAFGGLILGCDSKDPSTSNSGDTAVSKTEPPKKATEPKGDIAVIETSLGTIKFELLDNVAPKHVANFEKLADSKFYDGTAFHRVKPGFMIQGGDPNTKGSDSSKYGQGDPGYKIDAEFNDISFDRGIVGMARGGDPNSAGSQFFIVVGPSTFLDHQYTAFGKVTEGMDTVDKIVKLKTVGAPTDQVVDINGARVKSITITRAPGK
jgi:cyclophilin family peptidyl-prolyl cis-trans isomerase